MAELRIELLGGLHVQVGEMPAGRFRTQRAAALLAFLALHPGRQFSREELALLLWPDAPDESARISLRTALSHLRDAIGDAALRRDGNRTVGLADARTDVAAFEQAVAQQRWGDARALYRGELLPGFWDEWVLTERERIAALWERVPDRSEAPPTLPAELDRLWGRDTELAQIAADLRDARMVTLLGPGGIGKTRLALAAAHRVARDFPGGVWFVPLATLRDGRRIHAAVRDALGIEPNPRRLPLDQLAEFLTGEARCLLALDNLEQLAPYAAAEIRALLERIPNLTVLTTSRRRLGILGERQRTIGPLDTDGAVQLFVARARACTDQPLPDAEVRALCQALDSIPLAIELAAARCASLRIDQVRARVRERFALLTDTQAEKADRHRSLHAAIDWSCSLLTPEQRRLFLGLSVFSGGWTTEAAEAVCDDPLAAEYLAQLRERSLIQLGPGGRWSQLETLREFAQAQPGDRSAETSRHYDWCLSLARAGDPVALRSEADNLRAALDRAEPEPHATLALALAKHWYASGAFDDAEPALRRVTEDGPAAGRFNAWIWLSDLYEQRGDARTMQRCAQQAVRSAEALDDPLALTRARVAFAYAHTVLRQHDDALRLAQAALDAHPDLADAWVLARAQSAMGIARYFRDEFELSAAHFARGLELCESVGDRNGMAMFHGNLAATYLECGRYPDARAHIEAALSHARLTDQPYQIATHSSTLAWIAYIAQDWDAAARHNAEALDRARALSARLVLRNGLWVRACLDIQARRWDRAPRLFGAAARLSEETGTPMVPDDLARQETMEAQIVAAVGADALAAGIAAGRGLALDDAVALALA